MEVNDTLGKFLGRVREGETKAVALQRLVAPSAVLLDRDGIALLDDEVLTTEKAPYTLKPQQQRGQQNQDIDELAAAVKGLGLSIHAMQEQLPSVIVGHKVTPSTASRDRQVSSKVFEAVGLPLRPAEDPGEYVLPEPLANNRLWEVSFTWSTNDNTDRQGT